MTTTQLKNFTIKTTLAAADLLYGADSANSFNEVKVAFGNVPGNSSLNPNTSYSTAKLAIFDPINSTIFSSGTMSLSGTTLTISGGTLTNALLGGIVIWADGGLSMINTIINSTSASVTPSTTFSETSQPTKIYTGLAYYLQDANSNFGFTGIPIFTLNSNILTLYSGTATSQRAVLDLSAIVASGNGGGTYQFPDLNGIGVTKQFVMNADSSTSGTGNTMARYTTYYSSGASQVGFNVPATIALGDWFRIQGSGSGGFQINLAVGQTAYLTSVIHTSTSRSITSTDQYNAITLRALSSTTLGVEAFNGTFSWA